MSVQAVNQTLNARFVDMSDIGRRLARFLAEDDRVGVDQSECVDDDFAFDGLDGVDDDGDGAGVELLEGLWWDDATESISH